MVPYVHVEFQQDEKKILVSSYKCIVKPRYSELPYSEFPQWLAIPNHNNRCIGISSELRH